MTELSVDVQEAARQRAVARTGLADDGPDVTFDEMAAAAARLVGAPVALFTVVDGERTWCKGAAGLARGAAVAATPCPSVVASDRPVVVADALAEGAFAPVPTVEGRPLVAWAGFPVRDDAGHVVGAFSVADVVPRAWTAAELDALAVLAQAAADQVRLRAALRSERRARANAETAWLEAESARLDLEAARRREHEVVDLIQRSLLPARLPDVPGMETAVRFDASNTAADMGGDWYDVVGAGDDGALLVIGDICGHDVAAVAVMAQVRHFLHVLALRDPDPVAALAQLDALMLEQGFDRFATVALAAWDGSRGVVRHVSAGHPAPLVLRADGRTELLEGGRRPPVNVGLALPVDVAPTETALAPGDALVLFTDGLFEPWGPDPDVGLGRLRELAVVHGAAASVDELADGILAGMRPPEGWSDDVALVVARRS